MNIAVVGTGYVGLVYREGGKKDGGLVQGVLWE